MLNYDSFKGFRTLLQQHVGCREIIGQRARNQEFLLASDQKPATLVKSDNEVREKIQIKRIKNEKIQHHHDNSFFSEKPDTIYRAFQLDRNQFLDSPFYLFASRNLNVLDVFKSPYMQPEELEKWLSLIINQREF